MIPQQELLDKVQATGRVWVRLHSDIVLCLVAADGPDAFTAKFVPCAKNSREYRVRYSEVKEYVDRE